MIKTTYAKITNQNFTRAIQKLASLPLPTKTAYNVKKMVDAIQTARKTVSTAFEQVVQEYGQKDADGKLVRPKDDPNGFEIEETKMDEFTKAQDAFGQREIEIPRHKLLLEAFTNVSLSAAELSALDAFFDDPEEPGIVVENHENGTVVPITGAVKQQ